MRAGQEFRGLVRGALALVLLGCTQAGGHQPGPSSFRNLPEPAALVPAPRKVLRACLDTRAVRGACPHLVPKTEGRYRTDAFSPQKGHWTFFAESSGPYPGITPKNAPPRFAHLNIQGGDLSKAFAFPFPLRGPPVRLPERLPRRRESALYLGRFRWGDRSGALILAPSFPTGGIEGDHLIFRWQEGAADYAISLHAWRPLDVCAATLRAVVSSVGA
jgi:hypothetical protein